METTNRTASLKKKRRILGWVFLISICVFLSTIIVKYLKILAPAGTDSFNPAAMVSIISFLASLTSLIGFLSTTVLAWRKEKRETRSTELDIQKKELEIEKLRKESLNNSKTEDEYIVDLEKSVPVLAEKLIRKDFVPDVIIGVARSGLSVAASLSQLFDQN